MAINQHNNKCYRKTYVNDTSVPDGIITPEIVRGDTVPVGDLGVLETDVFGNNYYSLNSNYIKRRVDGTPVTAQPYQRCSYQPVIDPSTGKLKGVPCNNPSGDPIPDDAVAPNTCSIFAPFAAAWDRKTIDCVIVPPKGSVTNSQGLVVKGPYEHDARTYGKYDTVNSIWITESYENDLCEPRNPFTILVPVAAGGLEFTYMNGEIILTVEGDKVVSAPNTTILVPEEGNV